MANQPDRHQRAFLPIPDRPHGGLVTYDAKDPATRFAYRVIRGCGVDGQHDGIVKGNVLASFCHLRSTERSGCWARRFVNFVRARKQSIRSRCA